jgi:RHS repeat-associated protein
MVYDAFGKLVAEYGIPAAGAIGGVNYVQQDHQGSVRAVTNASGVVVARIDHQAFGEEIGFNVGLRSTVPGYTAGKATRQGYGLTENDTATGQQHTWFRKLETMAGRWTGPDPSKDSMNLSNPQSFNRFSYVKNNPINFVDPTGLDEVGSAVAQAQDLLKFGPCKDLVSKKGNPSKTLGEIYNKGRIRVTENVPTYSPNLKTGAPIPTGVEPFGNRIAVTRATRWKPNNNTGYTYTNIGIYIDRNGQFFSNSSWSTYEGSNIYLSQGDSNALTVIHELMHWFGRRTDDPSHNKDFDRSIYVLCFFLNPRWTGRNQGPIEATPGNPSTLITPRELIPMPTLMGGMGGYPSWYYSMLAFLDEIYSIQVGGGSVTVSGCVGSDCGNN